VHPDEVGKIPAGIGFNTTMTTIIPSVCVGLFFGALAALGVVVALDTWSVARWERTFDAAFRLLICIPAWGPAVGLLLIGNNTERISVLMTFIVAFSILFRWWFKY
jgi:hypothetical protein